MPAKNLKHKVLIGATVLAVAAFAGGAYAATESSTSPRQAFLNDVARRLNVTPAQLNAAIKAAYLDRLNAAVKAGTLTQAQANRIEKQIQAGGAVPFLPGGLGLGPRGLGPLGLRPRGLGPRGLGLLGLGPRGLGLPGLGLRGFGPRAVAPPAARPPGLLRGPMGLLVSGPLGSAAKYLGLTRSQLVKDLSSGKSLAQIAKSSGKSVSGLEQAIIGPLTTRLDRAVSKGHLTKAQEQRIARAMSALIAGLVTRAPMHPALRAWGSHQGAFRGSPPPNSALPGSLFTPPPPAAAGPPTQVPPTA